MIVLQLQTLAPIDYNNIPFDYSGELFTANPMTVSLSTLTDEDHTSMMTMTRAGTSTGNSQECYSDKVVTPGYKYTINYDHKVVTGQLGLKIINPNTSAVLLNDASASTGNSWKQYQSSEFTIPTGLSTIRIKLQKQSSVTLTAKIDNFAVNCNALKKVPDDYVKNSDPVARTHQAISGKRWRDILATHQQFSLAWNTLDDTQLNKLLDLCKSNEMLYFDDDDVPTMIEQHTINTEEILNYVGITNPSSTHIAYASASSLSPVAKTDFQVAEYATAVYTAIGVDDAVALGTAESGAPTNNYIYNKFLLKSSLPTADIHSLKLKVAGYGNDQSIFDNDGYNLYVWDGSQWVMIDSTYSSSKTYSNLNADTPEVAQMIVNDDKYIRLLMQTSTIRSTTSTLNIGVYYVEAHINEADGLTIPLTNRIKSINYVKNLTQNTTLTLGSTYKLSDDRRGVVAIGQANNDVIEVSYQHWFECFMDSLPDKFLRLNGESRDVKMTMRTLNKI